MSLAPNRKRHLSEPQSLRQPRRLEVFDVVEEQTRDRQHLQIINAGRFVFDPRPSAVFSRWKVQGINAVKPPVSSCRSRMRCRCLTRCSIVIADAKHHRRRRSQTDAMHRAHHVQPLIRRAFRRDALAHFVVENLGAAAGQTVKTRRLSAAP